MKNELQIIELIIFLVHNKSHSFLFHDLVMSSHEIKGEYLTRGASFKFFVDFPDFWLHTIKNTYSILRL